MQVDILAEKKRLVQLLPADVVGGGGYTEKWKNTHGDGPSFIGDWSNALMIDLTIYLCSIYYEYP